ncbi:hypothetical protein MTR_6g055095 [Medicago truncatula]|uniref:Uncharacterized protein n=1 Tax=Medicago truncatula TaxID=3880 RepID=A0A072UKS1_MEDTR|nr:hypothetical protein MTR_6g055095 [Medicago truncatula]
MVSEPLHDSLGHLLSGFRYWVTRHLCSRFRCAILSVRNSSKEWAPPKLPKHRSDLTRYTTPDTTDADRGLAPPTTCRILVS